MPTIDRSNYLADLAARIRAEHAAVREALRRGLEHAMAAGVLLSEAKQLAGHGHWLPFLASCGIPDRTASLYMRAARNREYLETHIGNVADLTLRAASAALTAARDRTFFGLPDDAPPLRTPGALGEEHIAPPFSVIETTAEPWVARKNAWIAQGVMPPLAALQQGLAQLGCYTGPIDGAWSPQTTAALAAFYGQC